MFSKDSILAVDLSTDAVRVLDVRQKKFGPRVQAFATQSVEAGSNETLPDRHLQALRSLINTHRLKSNRCVSALPTSLVISRSVAIDLSKPQTSEEQIRWTLQNCLPFDPKDLTFDFWPVGEPKPNARTRDVLVVAVQASVVQRYLQGFEALGLTCEHLDVAPCAVASLLIRQSSHAEGTICTVAIVENTGYFAVVEKKQLLFWRPFEVSTAGQKSTTSGLDRVGDEISKCVSHMVGTMQLDNLSELLLFGNGAEDVKFADYLTSRFHIPVRAPSPFDAFAAEAMSSEVRAAVPPNVATHFAAAVGLALQPLGVSNHG
jgi:Tfp pilus assembly PilM family ATPase